MIHSKSLVFVHFQCFVPDSTGHPLNIQTLFQSDPNVHGLSTNVLIKTYVIQRPKYVYIWTI